MATRAASVSIYTFLILTKSKILLILSRLGRNILPSINSRQ